jgi:hypothetical protein
MTVLEELLALFVVLIVVFGFFAIIFMIGFGVGRIGELVYERWNR